MYYQSICGKNGKRQGSVREKQREFLDVLLHNWYFFIAFFNSRQKGPKFWYFFCVWLFFFSAKNYKNKNPAKCIFSAFAGRKGKDREVLGKC
jgi:hypothetical protein